MNTDDLDAMKFDLRLRHRRGWVSESEVASHLESLPDVASKAGTAEASTETTTREAPALQAPPAAAPEPAPAPAAVPGVAAFGALPDDPASEG